MGEMERTASGLGSETVDGEGKEEMDSTLGGFGVGERRDEVRPAVSSCIGADVGRGNGSGSLGSSSAVSGEWIPTVFKGRRRVPLLGLGTRFSESQIML